MVGCITCGRELKLLESENKQEEFFETYLCVKCQKRFLRKVTFKSQGDEETLKEVI